ncbi:MAG TPA: crosslink repair DNA glycosylase YcaQ family protein [Actinocrinis sp.]|nr:crosslink repair DNA glycosylase YcaQ family protein [Actinocrinis sp.]
MTAAPAARTTLSADQARLAALRAQGLHGSPDRRAGVTGLLRLLGAVQLDTISVLARSQELVPFARLGPIGRDVVHDAYWSHPDGAAARTFEYWSHAASVLPVEEWPSFAFRRRAYRSRGNLWGIDTPDETVDSIKRRLAGEGPLTTTELGGGRKSSEWWDWSDVKKAVEILLSRGEVVCVARRNWKRVYDLPERVIPAQHLGDDRTDEECYVDLLALAGRALGVGTEADLLDYYRLQPNQLRKPGFAALAERAGLVPVQVEGWPARSGARSAAVSEAVRAAAGTVVGARDGAGFSNAWAHPEALLSLDRRGRHRTALLSPFDSLIWERARTERIFGLSHRLEAYVPKAKRIHGYFAMPLLHGGRLIGRADPAREGRTLIARQVSVDRLSGVGPMAAALAEAAAWVGCDTVRVERVLPESAAEPLRKAVAKL